MNVEQAHSSPLRSERASHFFVNSRITLAPHKTCSVCMKPPLVATLCVKSGVALEAPEHGKRSLLAVIMTDMNACDAYPGSTACHFGPF